MGEPVVTRHIQCSQCGAAHQVLRDALLVACEYCGAFVALRADEHWGGEAIPRRHARTIQALIEPTRADARKLEAQVAMGNAQAQGDREAWRLWAREYYAMLPITDPELVMGDPEDPRQVARWLRHTLIGAELCTFDPTITGAQQRYAVAVGELYRDPDPLAAARRALDEAEAFYGVLLDHPEYPRELAPGDPTHMARELVRSALAGAATMLGPGVTHRIRHEVLGDPLHDGPAVHCRSCGGRLLGTDGTQRCPHCGAVVQVETEDPWVTTMVGLWRSSRDQAPDDPAEALLALTLALSSYFTRKTLPSVQALERFLRAGPHWLARPTLLAAVELMRSGYDTDADVVAWLDQLEPTLADWEPHGERPAPPPPRARIPHDAPLDDDDPAGDPWVRQALVLWELGSHGHARDPSTLAASVIGVVLNPFYMGGSISVAQALAFIEAIEPQPARIALADTADLMRQAGAAPDAAPMLIALAAALRASVDLG